MLASLLVISAVAAEMAYSAHISYHIAAARRDEIRAQWLLRSSMAFGRLLLKYDKDLRAQASGLGPVAGVNLNAPFCAQMPFNTALLRAVFSVSGDEKPAADKPEKEMKEAPSELIEGGIIASQEAEDFLSFAGDFGLECTDEQARFNVNYFYEVTAPIDPASNAYDDHKSLLASLLSGAALATSFPDPREAVVLAGNIADWVDKDENINDFGKVVRGYESSQLPAGAEYKVKNGKFSSLEELHLVPGMTDDIYDLLSPQITLYGDNKVNICLAEPQVVAGLAVEYSKTSGRTAPLAPDNQTQIDKIVEAVKKECDASPADPAKIGARVEELLGATPAPALPGSAGGAPSATRGSFASMITTQSRFIGLKVSAQVGETELKGELVLDTKGPAEQWKTVYYRIY